MLEVRGARRTHRLRLREGLLTAPNVTVRIADLSGLALIDRRPGAEILVSLNRSASGDGVGVYTYRRGGLRYMRVAGSSRINGIFWHNVAGLAGSRADCVNGPASGYVVVMSYEANRVGRGLDIGRRLYRVEGDRFHLVWSRRYDNTSRTFPEQRIRSQFQGCRARR